LKTLAIPSFLETRFKKKGGANKDMKTRVRMSKEKRRKSEVRGGRRKEQDYSCLFPPALDLLKKEGLC